jgi:hypothetical protein
LIKGCVNLLENESIDLSKLELLRENLSKLSKKELIDLIILKTDIQVPVSVFSETVPPLESLTKYLIEVRKLSTNDIAIRLNRNFKTIWTTYSNARKKKLIFSESKYNIPLALFFKRKFSILETITTFLHDYEKLPFTRIAYLLNKDVKTVWTCYSRSKKKEASSQEINDHILRNKNINGGNKNENRRKN